MVVMGDTGDYVFYERDAAAPGFELAVASVVEEELAWHRRQRLIEANTGGPTAVDQNQLWRDLRKCLRTGLWHSAYDHALGLSGWVKDGGTPPDGFNRRQFKETLRAVLILCRVMIETPEEPSDAD